MPLFKQTETCPNCGHETSSQSRFCPECGTAMGGTKTCPHCQKKIPTAAQFCPECGRSLSGAAREPDMRGGVWRASPDEFAVRVEPENLQGTLYKEIEIQPGQQVVLLVDGRALDERKGPGRYSVKSLFDWLLTLGGGRHVTALVVRGDPVRLDFQFPSLFTEDSYRVAGRCALNIQVANPPVFFANVMGSQPIVTLNDLRLRLFDQVGDAVQDVVGGRKLNRLISDLQMKGQLATAIDAHLRQSMGESGLTINQVTTADFTHQRYDAMRQGWEDVRLTRDENLIGVEREKVELDLEKLRDQLTAEGEDLETARQRKQARFFEERAAVREQMRQAVLSEDMDKVRSEEQLAVYLRSVDKDRLIRDDEWEVMQRDFAERKEEHNLARAHLLAQLKMERDYELRMAQGLRSHELTMDQLGQQRKEQDFRQQTQIILEEEQAAWDIRLQEQRNKARRAEQAADDSARRERDLLDRQQTLELQLAAARTEAEIDRIEREQDRLDIELGLMTLEKMKAIKRKDQEERALLALRLQKEQAEMALRAESQRHQQELERMQQLGQLSTEALIVVSGPEQAALLADLRRTEALKGMSEEQILVMVAEKSPAVAAALQEKYRAMVEGRMSEREQALYERLLEEQKLLVQAQQEMSESQARRQQEMFSEALRSQAEVAKAFAQSQGASSGATVVYPPASGVGYSGGVGPSVVGPGGFSGEVQICTKCHVRQPVGRKYCENCGNEFF